MILGLLLWTETEKGNIPRAKKALTGLGLVPARYNYADANSETYDDVMVWEDPQEHIGRYRVHLYENEKIEENTYDVINFHYWLNKRSLKKEILAKEPMDNAIEAVMKVLEGRIEVQNWNTHIMALEDALRSPKIFRASEITIS